VRVVDAQIAAGPTPRWQHRDCAGLVRFAVNEAFRTTAWRRASGMGGPLPPEVALTATQRPLRTAGAWPTAGWRIRGGAGAGAEKTIVSRDLNAAQPGDLLFFDQGDDQHLMVWTGRYIAYHTGTSRDRDDGLRAVSVRDLMAWRDTRWQPVVSNPNFLGVYRLRFLSR
jgi:uncharacterized protein YfaT (DUF1175 family)